MIESLRGVHFASPGGAFSQMGGAFEKDLKLCKLRPDTSSY